MFFKYEIHWYYHINEAELKMERNWREQYSGPNEGFEGKTRYKRDKRIFMLHPQRVVLNISITFKYFSNINSKKLATETEIFICSCLIKNRAEYI